MSATKKVRKAVLPVAGLGTRFLPVTKAVPKEMLPLVDKPLIQFAVEEAVASGIEEIILVTSSGKDSIEHHLRDYSDLVRLLEKHGKREQAQEVPRVGQLARIVTVHQEKPLGLGHAVGCARERLDQEPFAVLLPDDIIDAPVPCTQQLIEVYEAHPGCIVATEEVRGPAIERYGVMAVEPMTEARWQGRLFQVTDLVEKPRAAEAPSHYGIIGRYILEPGILDCIAATLPGRGGEIQLTDALKLFARQRAVYSYIFEGFHHDVGDKLGFLQATVYYGLKHPELGPAFRNYLRSLRL